MKDGHVTLDGRPYQLVDIRRYADTLANQMAPKISEGDQKYSSLDSWSAWIQSDWQQGLGHVRPAGDDTGYLFGECDTRVPHQIILPPLLQVCDRSTIAGTKDDERLIPTSISGSYSLDHPSGDIQKLRFLIDTNTGDGTGPSEVVYWFYAQVAYGNVLKVSLYDYDDSQTDDMGDLIGSGQIQGNVVAPSWYWWGVSLGEINADMLEADRLYWVVVETTSIDGTVEIAYADDTVATFERGTDIYDGSSWTEQDAHILFMNNSLRAGSSSWTADDSARGSHFTRFNGETYFVSGNTIWQYNAANENFDSVVSVGSDDLTYSVAVFGPNLYIAKSDGLYKMSTSETVTDTTLDARLLLQYKGFLWRTDDQNLYYTADASTWVGPFAMGGSDVKIRGMAGMNGDMYCATDKALMRLAPGDVVEEIFRFGAEDSANGLGMLEKDNTLYIPAGGRLYRYGPDGVLLDIWAGRDDDLPAERLGRIDALCRMNQWIVALVNAQGSSQYSRPMVLAYQTEGWHPLAVLHNEKNLAGEASDMALFYDRENSRLWIGCNAVGPLFLDIPDYALNPYNLTSYKYMPYAWIEWDWFDGPIRELMKDCDSIQVVGRGLTSDTYADVYWRDDDSVFDLEDDKTGWEYLGRFDSDSEEIRWTYPYSTRPVTRRIKLGMRLYSGTQYATPRIDAIRLKYHLMTRDWFRFTLPIMVSGVIDSMQQLSDGTVQEYTGSEQLAHLKGLATQDLPFLYTDPVGDTYEVKVTEAAFQLDDWERLPEGGIRWDGIYTLTLEQVTTGEYSA